MAGRDAAASRLSPDAIIFLTMAVAALAISAFVVVFARNRDAGQMTVVERIVAFAVKDSLAKVGDALAPNTYWDAAYDHITDHVEDAWATANLGPYDAQTSGVNAVLIFDASLRPIYAYRD